MPLAALYSRGVVPSGLAVLAMVASMVLVLRIDNRLPVHLKPVVPVMVWAVLATVNELRLPKLPVPELVVQAASSNGLGAERSEAEQAGGRGVAAHGVSPIGAEQVSGPTWLTVGLRVSRRKRAWQARPSGRTTRSWLSLCNPSK